ncbi:bifunctional adenosylcobinamide kinase/adenosylcobinamide-phosphate guanylyltransferase [Flammeovirga sp. SubArs3]|uniref:bifunctional adenosylcobinamide kinase/adenosylcobinamide-phosphate guanylyltransferase n=1 Tax=Flammeovirga sp. SubArs3 TaxID=2995316 RepID=UPI00248D385F|nr:bifunctional adenosylcobinamide kinase/adenosylcobinamide-phosphate guanylyltransferase [Flammeovirga sp. SubArs3]
MKANIHLITGGQRSGKSAFAEQVTLGLTNTPIYLATSKKWDEEHNERITLHQARREECWTTVEEPIDIHQQDFSGQVVLLDCITLWLTNIFDEVSYDKEKALQKAKEIWNSLIQQDCTLVVVSNEIGLGGISMNKASRQFTDIHGLINQFIAKQAQKVTFVVSGLPMTVKE